MISSLRKGAGGWVAKAFLGILVVSFAVWGVADWLGSSSRRALATVGGVEITPEQFQAAYQEQLAALSARFGTRLTPDQARMLGVEQQVLAQLIGGAAIDSHVADLGLGASDAPVAEAIREDETFFDSTGKFSREVLQERLRSVGLTEAGYIARQREASVRSQVTLALTSGVRAPAPLVKAAHTYTNETRQISHFTLTADDAGVIPEPTEADLKAFYDSNTRDFGVPEYRRLGVLLLDVETLKDTIAITDEALRAAYEAQKDTLGTPERRRVLLMTFPSAADAQTALTEMQGGKSFEDIAKARGLMAQDYDLGVVARSTLVDPKVAEAAFALKVNETSPPIAGALTTGLVRVTEIQPGNTPSFGAVSPTLRAALQREKAAEKAGPLFDQVEDERSAGLSLAEIADKVALPYQLIEKIDARGQVPEGATRPAVAGLGEIVPAAFDSDVGIDNNAVDLPGGGAAWYEVLDVMAASTRPFEEVKTRVAEAWRAREIRQRLAVKAEALAADLKPGKTFADIAASAGKTVATADPVKRTDTAQGLPRAVVTQAFALAQGRAGSAQGDSETSRVVFTVIEAKAPADDAATTAQLGQQIAAGLENDLLVQYVAALQRRYDARVSQPAIDAVLGRAGSGPK